MNIRGSGIDYGFNMKTIEDLEIFTSTINNILKKLLSKYFYFQFQNSNLESKKVQNLLSNSPNIQPIIGMWYL